MQAAGWFPADPVTWRTSVEIVGSVVLDRPYHDAPVSPLYYQGKKEQLAFEKPDGKSADRGIMFACGRLSKRERTAVRSGSAR